MRDSSLRDRLWVFTLQGEDLAQPTNTIDLDPTVTDAFGLPAGRVTYRPHRHELVLSRHVAPLHETILRDAGAEWVITTTSPPKHDPTDPGPVPTPASYHIMGTCRMGTDAATSVVDPHGHLWDVENVMVADSSVFPTSAGYNPTLTLVSVASMFAHDLVGEPLATTTSYR
jgi:choline dehydrogenase-like flavoprotein